MATDDKPAAAELLARIRDSAERLTELAPHVRVTVSTDEYAKKTRRSVEAWHAHRDKQAERSAAGNETKRDRAEGRRRLVAKLATEYRDNHDYDIATRSTRRMARDIAAQLAEYGERWSVATVRRDLAALGIR